MIPTIVLRVVCAWCGRELVAGSPGAPISHGMCPACAAAFVEEVA